MTALAKKRIILKTQNCMFICIIFLNFNNQLFKD